MALILDPRRWARSGTIGGALVALSLNACGIPKDQEGASARIAATHVLRVGASANPPWVIVQGNQVTGIEPSLICAFATTMGAKVAWVVNGETPLLEALERRQLDIVVGGVTSRSPWIRRVGTSLSYARAKRPPGGRPGLDQGRERHIILSAPGENRLLLRLDQFLHAAGPAVQRRIDAEATHG